MSALHEGSLIYHQGIPVIFFLTDALYKYIWNACFLLAFHDGTTVDVMEYGQLTSNLGNYVNVSGFGIGLGTDGDFYIGRNPTGQYFEGNLTEI